MPYIDNGGGSGYTHPATHPADIITISDTANNFTATEVEGALAELFQSVVNGKASLKTSIIGKGGTVSQAGASPTFTELNNGVNSIVLGGQVATGTTSSVGPGGSSFTRVDGSTDNSMAKLVVTGLNFKPDEIIWIKPGSLYSLNYWAYDRLNSTYTIAVCYEGTTTPVMRDYRITTQSTGVGVGLGAITTTGFTVPCIATASYFWIARKGRLQP